MADKIKRSKDRTERSRKGNQIRIRPIPEVEVEEELWKQSRDSFYELLHKRQPPSIGTKRLPALSAEELLKMVRAEKREAEQGSLMLVDHSINNIEFDKESLRYKLKNIEKLVKPRKETKKAYYQAVDDVETMLAKREWNTTRGMYYKGKSVYRGQQRFDLAMKNLCSKKDVDRNQMQMVTEKTGAVIGDLRFKIQKAMMVNCNADVLCQPRHGVRVPDDVRTISQLEGKEIKFILVVESYAVYFTLASAGFHIRHKCLLITGKGMPVVAVREFINYLAESLGVAVFLLTDCDPGGLEIYSVYKYGSLNMAFDSGNLANPKIIWIGVWPSDITEYGLTSDEMSAEQEKSAHQLLKKDFVSSDPRLERELRQMIQYKETMSIKALKSESDFIIMKLKHFMDDFLKQHEDEEGEKRKRGKF